MLFDLAEAGAEAGAGAEAEAGGVGTAGVGGAAQVQGARRVPQHYGADWGIRSRLGSLTPKSHRYASLAGSLWLSRLANPNRLLDHLRSIALGS